MQLCSHVTGTSHLTQCECRRIVHFAGQAGFAGGQHYRLQHAVVTLDDEDEVLKLSAETLHDMQRSLAAVSLHQPGGGGEPADRAPSPGGGGSHAQGC